LLKSIAAEVAKVIGRKVGFVEDHRRQSRSGDCRDEAATLFVWRTRAFTRARKRTIRSSSLLAKLGDLWVNDAFSVSHRAHVSTEGLGHALPAYAGRTMQAELDALSAALEAPQRPVAAIVGGAKVSTKLELLGNLVAKVNVLIIGGGMANTFLAAQGKNVGKSLCEHDLAATARDILAKAKAKGCEIVLPVDVVVAKKFEAHALRAPSVSTMSAAMT
jgi:phosphoglycerate kinase